MSNKEIRAHLSRKSNRMANGARMRGETVEKSVFSELQLSHEIVNLQKEMVWILIEMKKNSMNTFEYCSIDLYLYIMLIENKIINEFIYYIM